MDTTDILYIEDNEDYISFVKRAVTRLDAGCSVGIVTDGQHAIEALDQASGSKKYPRLILLDLHLPDYNGIDLLELLRAREDTRYIPVVMFSSSDNPADMKRAMDTGANAYLVKPAGLVPLTQTLTSICNFWLSHHPGVEKFAA